MNASARQTRIAAGAVGGNAIHPTHSKAAQREFTGDLPTICARARDLCEKGRRRILGITGAPGCGKSTVAAALIEALAPDAALVPMDGFHLANSELVRLGRRDRKGAVDTFDGAGYVALLRRLKNPDEDVVYAPQFRREIEEAIAGAIPVSREIPLVVTEGNYLLVESQPWSALRSLIDEVWFLESGEDIRIERLIARHIAYGKTPEFARAWSLGTDQRNADLINSTRKNADLVVRL
ncbi:MAG: nucleoside/nucleotide kinase family protein [Roseiarcus sp.]|jgi:pantothenate kinase